MIPVAHEGTAPRRGAAPAARAARKVWATLADPRGAGWAIADQSVVSAANFLTIYLFARRLDSAAFGVLMLAYTGLLLLTSVQHALLAQPHNVLAAGLARDEYRRFTAVLTALQVLTCVIACGALAAAGAAVAQFDPAAGRVIVVLAAVAAPWLAHEFVRRVLYTRQATRTAFVNDAVACGLQVAGAAALVLAPSPPTPVAARGVLGGSAFVAALLGAWQLRDHVRFHRDVLHAFGRVWREVWGFGKWLSAQNALAWAGTQGDVWLVTAMLGTEAVGVYRAATHLANIMNPLRQAAYSHLPARASLALEGGGPAALARWVARSRRLMLVAVAPFVAVLGCFPAWALDVAYGGRFAGNEAALILALVTLAQSIIFVKFAYDAGLLALRSTRSIFLVYLIPAGMLFTVGAAAIHFLGLLGVPVFSIASGIALLAATRFMYLRRLREAAP
jgi:O-antigen/teichoic acid export membrane protein